MYLHIICPFIWFKHHTFHPRDKLCSSRGRKITFFSLLGFKASQFLSKNSFYATMSIACMWQGIYVKGFCGNIIRVYFNVYVKIYYLCNFDSKRRQHLNAQSKMDDNDGLMQNIIIITTWLTCPKTPQISRAIFAKHNSCKAHSYC